MSDDPLSAQLGPIASAVMRALDRAGVDYWIDSGSLLGLVRDGHLPAWDKDIDLGVWAEQAGTAAEALRHTVASLPEVQFIEKRLAGRTYALIVRAQRSSGSPLLPVAIHVFFERNGSAVSPQPHLLLARGARVAAATLGLDREPSLRGKLRKLLRGTSRHPKLVLNYLLVRLHLHRVVAFLLTRRFAADRDGVVSIHPYEHTAGRFFYHLYHWVIPAKHFRQLERIYVDGGALPIPGSAPEYLALRYGDSWVIPRQDWFYVLDDGSLQRG